MSTRKRNYLIGLIAYLIVLGVCLGCAVHQDRRSEELHAARGAGSDTDYVFAAAAARMAGFFRAGAVLATVVFLLVLGTAASPAPLRLVCGNILVFLGLLLLLETATRLAGWHFPAIGRPGIAGDFGLWVYDETKGWFHAPSSRAESYFGGPDRGVVRINALGLRGGEIQPAESDETRILVFGDSYVFGVGVDEENLVTTRLERLLRPYFPDGIEVVNMGVSGYSTDQELLLLEELGSVLEPDMVVLVVCDNDYVANTENFAWRRYYKPYFDVDDDGRLHLRNVPVPRLSPLQEVKLWLGQESNVWNLVRSRQSENPVVNGLIRLFQVDVPRAPRRPYKTTRALVKAFSDAVARLDASLLVTSTGRRGENPTLFESLSRYLSEERIHHLDLLPVLQAAREREPNRLWDFGDDTHWNRDAHELVARTLCDTILARYVAELRIGTSE